MSSCRFSVYLWVKTGRSLFIWSRNEECCTGPTVVLVEQSVTHLWLPPSCSDSEALAELVSPRSALNICPCTLSLPNPAEDASTLDALGVNDHKMLLCIELLNLR